MKYIRIILTPIILFIDAITRPKPIVRTLDDQKLADQKAKNLALYQYNGCPFCIKVRRALHKLNVKIDLLDAKDEKISQELIEGGGSRKVPCLRINDNGNTRWMYESKDIISFLNNLFV